MGRVDTFGDYVQRRLDEWGAEFALHRECEYLGHQSKNMLQVLIEHKGEMPQRPTGFKPLEIPLAAMQIEDIVCDIARAHVARACVLRAMYCGRGRFGVERYEQAKALVAKCAGLSNLTRRQYYTLAGLAEERVHGVLQGLARA